MNHAFITSDYEDVFHVFLTYGGNFLKTREKLWICGKDTTYFCEAETVFISITERTCSCKALITIILTY